MVTILKNETWEWSADLKVKISPHVSLNTSKSAVHTLPVCCKFLLLNFFYFSWRNVYIFPYKNIIKFDLSVKRSRSAKLSAYQADGHWPFCSKEVLPYMGMAAILVMSPRPTEQTSITPTHGGSTLVGSNWPNGLEMFGYFDLPTADDGAGLYCQLMSVTMCQACVTLSFPNRLSWVGDSISFKVASAPNKDLDPRRLIRVGAQADQFLCLPEDVFNPWPQCALRRFRSNCADAHVDLNLRRAHMQSIGNDVPRLRTYNSWMFKL